MSLSADALKKLHTKKNLWISTIRPDGRPHLTPVWFVYLGEKFYISIDPRSVKSRNLARNPQVSVALENGSHPVICEGIASIPPPPAPPEVLAAFFEKFEWDLTTETQYFQLVEITPRKWLAW